MYFLLLIILILQTISDQKNLVILHRANVNSIQAHICRYWVREFETRIQYILH